MAENQSKITSHNFLFLKTSNLAYLIRLLEGLLTTVEKSKLLEANLTTFTSKISYHIKQHNA